MITFLIAAEKMLLNIAVWESEVWQNSFYFTLSQWI